jgi:hypothetical protein
MYTTITTNVKSEIKTKFIEYCKKNNTTPNKKLKQMIYGLLHIDIKNR